MYVAGIKKSNENFMHLVIKNVVGKKNRDLIIEICHGSDSGFSSATN